MRSHYVTSLYSKVRSPPYCCAVCQDLRLLGNINNKEGLSRSTKKQHYGGQFNWPYKKITWIASKLSLVNLIHTSWFGKRLILVNVRISVYILYIYIIVFFFFRMYIVAREERTRILPYKSLFIHVGNATMLNSGVSHNEP